MGNITSTTQQAGKTIEIGRRENIVRFRLWGNSGGTVPTSPPKQPFTGWRERRRLIDNVGVLCDDMIAMKDSSPDMKT